jgi:hypothetical protein
MRLSLLTTCVVLLFSACEQAPVRHSRQSITPDAITLNFRVTSGADHQDGSIALIPGEIGSVTVPGSDGSPISFKVKATQTNGSLRVEVANSTGCQDPATSPFQLLRKSADPASLGTMDGANFKVDFHQDTPSTAVDASALVSSPDAIKPNPCSCGGACPCCVASTICSACCGSYCTGCGG